MKADDDWKQRAVIEVYVNNMKLYLNLTSVPIIMLDDLYHTAYTHHVLDDCILSLGKEKAKEEKLCS